MARIKGRSDQRQEEFNFDEARRRASLESLQFAPMWVTEGKSPVRVGASKLKSVLMRIADHQWTSGVCWASANTIAKVLNCHERTVRRACNGLVSLQLLIVRDDTKGKPIRYAINWGEIAAREAGKPASNPGHSYTNPGHSVRRTQRTLKNLTTSTSERSNGRAAYGGDPDPWDVVVSSLDGLGMGDAAGAVERAKTRGLAPADVERLIAEFMQLTAVDSRVHVGYLHRWVTGKGRPPSAERPQTVSPLRKVSLTSETVREEMVRSQVVKSRGLAGASETEIAAAVREALAAKMPRPSPRNDSAMHNRQAELMKGFSSYQ